MTLDGRPLTSERVRHAIEIACLEKGAQARQTIVAGGEQACDPHCQGTGPLRPNELIVIDVFPRVARTGYFGDMTRTFLKGRASPQQRRLVNTVRQAQQKALETIKAGVTGGRIHAIVENHFKAAGYRTNRSNGRPEGFIHGTGHGLGLEIHEPPRLNRTGPRLKAGSVITVEPGLYYRGLGGCRIEDVGAGDKNRLPNAFQMPLPLGVALRPKRVSEDRILINITTIIWKTNVRFQGGLDKS